jgi:hypothetical protein
MSTEVTLTPKTDRGREILDELEDRTTSPFRRNLHTGARSYWRNAFGVPETGFRPVLEDIASDWREHLSVTL